MRADRPKSIKMFSIISHLADSNKLLCYQLSFILPRVMVQSQKIHNGSFGGAYYTPNHMMHPWCTMHPKQCHETPPETPETMYRKCT